MGDAGARNPRNRSILLWSIVAIVVVAGGALLATGKLNASLLPKPAVTPVPLSVQCFHADGSLITGWTADSTDGGPVPRVDPISVCTALIEDDQTVAQMDALVTRQRALGRDCVFFDTTDGGKWVLAGLESPGGTYSASGGPAPGHLPAFGQIAQPAPLVSLAPAPAPPAGCVALPTLKWKLSMPPLAACTSDDLTVSVYQRRSGQNAQELCASKQLVVAGT